VAASEVGIVVPTAGRPSLQTLLDALGGSGGRAAAAICVVDDRRCPHPPLRLDVPPALRGPVRILVAGGRGPAAARNTGWRACPTPWIAFLDDDVVPADDWLERLAADIAAAGAAVGGIQGQIAVPLPAGRPPTDWERNVAGLETAAWATADMAYRRAALVSVGGFDERFPRAYREDADLALRIQSQGWSLVRGTRAVAHPVRPAPQLVSLRLQAGNADDALMRRVHGPSWRRRAIAPRGRLPWHAATLAAAGLAAVGLVLGRPHAARFGVALWAALTADFAWRRIAPGPRTPREVGAMALTSALIPPLAVTHRLAGVVRRP
jgi:hypothetical protein